MVTFIVLTKDRPQMLRRLIGSILDAKLASFSLVLIDDSESDNFLQTRNFLKSQSIQSEQLTSLQAGEEFKKTLKKIDLTSDEKRFIRNCAGLVSPFSGYVEEFFDGHKLESSPRSAGLRFAPYSAARNLGIYCAVKSFNAETIFFLDDDCVILNPESLRHQVELLKTRLSRKDIVAVAGVYKDVEGSGPRKVLDQKALSIVALRILRGMDAFLRKSYGDKTARFKTMPSHVLGGALVLSRNVFCNLPFDPYVARGEDHAYAWDLKSHLRKDEIAVRDNCFVIGHQKEEISHKPRKMDVLRDIFRFFYFRAKTGRSFIPFFIIRWIIAALVDLLLHPSEYNQFAQQLRVLIFLGPRFAKEDAYNFRRNLKAWNNFLVQLTAC